MPKPCARRSAKRAVASWASTETAGATRSPAASKFVPKDWYEATDVCAAQGKVLCGVDEPCSRSGCSYDHHYQWTGEECQADDAGLPAAC